eukprot:14054234-Alexandrium_andersonii.AAC.1
MPPEVGGAAVRPEDVRSWPAALRRVSSPIVPAAQAAEGRPPPPARAKAGDGGAAQEDQQGRQTTG